MIPPRWCQLHRWRGSWRLEQIQTVGNDKKTRLSMTKSTRHRTRNAVNGAVKMLGRREIMTKVVLHPWPKSIVTDWNHFNDDASIVTEWRHICDENYHFVTYDQMWRDHSDEIQIVTNSSQMNISDDYGVFSDIRWTSSMTTSLLVYKHI
jgi:hypothetical protein